MSDIRHANSLEIERRTKVLLSQSTDVLKDRLAKGFILVVSSVSSVLDNFYIYTSKQVADIYYSKKGFIDVKPNQLHLCSILSKQKSLAKIELKNEWIAIVLDYSCPYLGRKYKSEIKKALSDIISFDKNSFSIIFEEKDSLVNMYYWIRLTYSPDITNGDNLWVKSKTLDFKNDELFCSEIQQQIHTTFGYTIEKDEVKDNFDEIMELFRMKNY
jgi:hypothetical protein